MAEAESDSAFERSKYAIDETALLKRESRSLCEITGNHVRYAGSTDLGLYTCLYEAAQAGANHLTITSFGGPVVNAIPAANIIASHEMSVSILGVCASSCGNYIAPAAVRLSVLPFSVWSVHGAPEGANETALRSAMANSGASEEQIERSIAQNIRQSQNTVALHEAFRARHGIQSGLYDADLIKSAEDKLGSPNLLYLSPETATACVPAIRAENFWGPDSPDEEAKLQQLFPSRTLGEYGALTEGRACREVKETK